MRDLSRLVSVGAFLFLASTLFAQTNSSAPAPEIKYFSLEHRAPDAMDAADRDLLHARQKELLIEAQIYGYDLTTGNWTHDQAICPQLPNTLLLHYLDKFPDGSESLFTVLIPRNGGRTRIVPVLYHNAAPFLPAVRNPRNFAIFNELVPAEIAKAVSGPDGKWLSFGVCYAEVVGGRPNVPNEPSLDVATIKAPPALFRIDATSKQRQVQFPDRGAAKVFTIWTVSLDQNGRVTAAVNEDYGTYVARILHPPPPSGTTAAPPAPVGTTMPPPPPSSVIPPPPDPPSTITNPPPVPQH
jgi:hypothetical protein